MVFPDPLVVLGSQDPRETVASPASQDPKATSDPLGALDQPFRAPREAEVHLDPQDEEVRGEDSEIFYLYLRDTLLPGLVTRLVYRPGYRSGLNSWLPVWIKQLVTGLVSTPGSLSGSTTWSPVWFTCMV